MKTDETIINLCLSSEDRVVQLSLGLARAKIAINCTMFKTLVSGDAFDQDKTKTAPPYAFLSLALDKGGDLLP